MKIYASDHFDRALAVRHGGVAVQVTPPWRYIVGPELRQWADVHRASDPNGPDGSSDRPVPEPITDADREAVLDLEVDHYMAQHASWSPTASREVMRAELGEDHEPGSEGAYDSRRSVLLRGGGRVVAAALLWPGSNGAPADGSELSLLSRPYVGPHSRRDKESCLAAVIDASEDGDALLIDSHLTEDDETAMMRDLPGLVADDATDWMAIVAVPVPGGPTPAAFPRERVPARATWVEELLPRR